MRSLRTRCSWRAGINRRSRAARSTLWYATSTVRAAGMTSSMPARSESRRALSTAITSASVSYSARTAPGSTRQQPHLVKARNSKPACSRPTATAAPSSAAPGVSLWMQIEVIPRPATSTACRAAASPSVSSAPGWPRGMSVPSGVYPRSANPSKQERQPVLGRGALDLAAGARQAEQRQGGVVLLDGAGDRVGLCFVADDGVVQRAVRLDVGDRRTGDPGARRRGRRVGRPRRRRARRASCR